MVFNLFKRKPPQPDNDPLLKAIIAMAASGGTPEAQRTFYNVLLLSTLLMAQEEPNNPRPILLQDDSGEVVLPVFTDLERLKKVFDDAAGYAALPAQQLFNLAVQNDIGIVNINPQYGPGGDLVRYELEALAKGELPDVSDASDPSLSEPTLVPFGSPKLPPVELINKMADAARAIISREPSVQAGYIILTSSEQGNPKLAVALRFDDSANVKTRSALSQQLVPVIEAAVEQPMDVLWLEGERYEAVRAKSQPFYTRDS